MWWVELVVEGKYTHDVEMESYYGPYIRQERYKGYLWVPWQGTSVGEARRSAVEYFKRTYPMFTFESFLAQTKVPNSVKQFLEGGIVE